MKHSPGVADRCLRQGHAADTDLQTLGWCFTLKILQVTAFEVSSKRAHAASAQQFVVAPPTCASELGHFRNMQELLERVSQANDYVDTLPQ